MSTLVALKHNDTLVIGSDSQFADGSPGVRVGKKFKFALGLDVALGFSGTWAMGDVLFFYKDKLLQDKPHPVELVRRIKETWGESGFKPKKEELCPDYECSLIYVCDKQIYKGCSALSLIEAEEVVIGTGREFVCGSLYSSVALGVKERVKLALEAACFYDTGSGPPIFVYEQQAGNGWQCLNR